MKCPRCESTTLDERERESIVVDVCASCRGVWLDRGELEKLIARATRDLDEVVSQERDHERPLRPDSTPPRSVRYRDDERPRDPRERRDHYDGDRGYRRKKSWIESLGDIFD